MWHYGTDAQKAEWMDDLAAGRAASRSASPSPTTARTPRTWKPRACAMATTGSSTARRRGTPASTRASHDMIMARTVGQGGRRRRHHGVPRADQVAGLQVLEYPLDVQHALRPRTCPLKGVRVPDSAYSAARGAVCRWCSTSSTRTGSGRRHPRWARRSTASTKRWRTRMSARRSARSCRATRRSSSRSSSCRRSARCCGR
jgi:hypothetical protein